MIAIIITLSIILVAVIAFIFFYFYQIKYDKFIRENSLCLRKLKEINNRYKFNPDIRFDQTHTYDNEQFYNTISCQDYLIYQLQFIGKKVIEQIKKTTENRQIYTNYLSEIKTISDFGKFQAPAINLNSKRLIVREKRCLRKYILRKPKMQFHLAVTLYRSDINARVFEKKAEIFDSDTLCALLKRVNNKKGTFYNDRAIWDAICRVERGKVSNKMRFAIYKRDGYRCCRCGASDRFTYLEIDHIIPISKGGKSTYDNLQTLCRKCNIEKGDNIP